MNFDSLKQRGKANVLKASLIGKKKEEKKKLAADAAEEKRLKNHQTQKEWLLLKAIDDAESEAKATAEAADEATAEAAAKAADEAAAKAASEEAESEVKVESLDEDIRVTSEKVELDDTFIISPNQAQIIQWLKDKRITLTSKTALAIICSIIYNPKSNSFSMLFANLSDEQKNAVMNALVVDDTVEMMKFDTIPTILLIDMSWNIGVEFKHIGNLIDSVVKSRFNTTCDRAKNLLSQKRWRINLEKKTPKIEQPVVPTHSAAQVQSDTKNDISIDDLRRITDDILKEHVFNLVYAEYKQKNLIYELVLTQEIPSELVERLIRCINR